MGSATERVNQQQQLLQLPVIDISQQNLETGKQLVDAAIKFGFLYINTSGTGFTPDIVDHEFELSRKFFAMPTGEKEKYPYDSTNRGWAGLDNEKLDPNNQKRADFKEVFNIGEFDDHGKLDQKLPPLFMENISQHEKFQTLCEQTCHRILDLIELGLEVEEEGFFAKRHTKPSGSTFRMLHYPAVPSGEVWDEADVRAGAHSDYGSLTLLFQRDGQPGLEIRTPENESWAPVPVIPDGYENSDKMPPILVNIADLMNYWTNGLLRSTVHRVIFPKGAPKGEDRYSLVFFCHPANDTQLVPVPSKMVREKGDIAEGEEVGYGGGSATKRAMTAKEHLLNRLQATYSYRKEDEKLA